MVKKIARVLIGLFGMLLGYLAYTGFKNLELVNVTGVAELAAILIFIAVFGIIFFIFSTKILRQGQNIARIIEGELQKFSIQNIALGAVGLIVGLVVATLISQPIYRLNIPYLGVIASIVLYLLFGYLGVTIPNRNIEDITTSLGNFTGNIGTGKKNQKETKVVSGACPKILDTSVIIDGRIADIVKTGFIEGPLVIPVFVLEELQHIADSSDGLKRNRGRRGLDILNRIQNELDTEIIIHEKEFAEVNEVDSKLLKLTQYMQGKVITNDYNLNKVAEVHRIEVLNINELANAVKPVVLPGEEMVVQVVKDGKEAGQGLAYLDDGTMIVVESGRKFIGETIDVIVTSVLQTSAGRMIFAKPKSLYDKVS
ncbi:PIN/TRAM domain-containing protein [Gudongella sp. DL1XJH-153]|uniref:PIN/TRAM domain-containing protein n=1 Tax=Gudongella sp. DL1XJH-153 TaxID=3409804 RepID=UPI003BB5813B